jgi:hypothetical protein
LLNFFGKIVTLRRAKLEIEAFVCVCIGEIMTRRSKLGRALFYHRDSHGKSEMTPAEYVGWATRRTSELGASFNGRPEQIDEMIRLGIWASGDIFLDYGVKGNLLSRDGWDALLEVALADPTVSHVLIPRRDRLARPDNPVDGLVLEGLLRGAGITLVFMDKLCPPFPKGKRRDIGELITAVVDYEKSGTFRRELAEKILYAQLALARLGYSTGGRPPYGFRRWLIKEDGTLVRKLEEGEYVRMKGHHVVWLPGPKEELDVIRRILRDLEHIPAFRIAQALTDEGVPSPDYGRMRRDNGIRHQVSGVWHATTVTSIARNSLLVGTATYGRRSMGDQLRFHTVQPRELTETDYREDGKEKVTQNADSHHIRTRVPVAFELVADPERHTNLLAILDKRGATQRGKPRSHDPKNNPLGSRVFDINCTWPMYRQPHGSSFRYLCGFYQQTHGQKCNHNHVDGPTAVRFLLACMKQRVLAPSMLEKLEERLKAIAAREMIANRPTAVIETKQAALATLIERKRKAERNMAFAENRDQYQAIATIVEGLRQEQLQLVAEIKNLAPVIARAKEPEREVAAAMELARRLTELPEHHDDYAALAGLFSQVNARLFVRFQTVQEGKRTLNKVQSGVVTFGSTPPPITPYTGPTGRQKLKGPTTESTVGPVTPSSPSPLEPIGSGREGKSLGNVSRGERI